MDENALNAIADHFLAARREIATHGDNPLLLLVDLTLLETGRQLAARIRASREAADSDIVWGPQDARPDEREDVRSRRSPRQRRCAS